MTKIEAETRVAKGAAHLDRVRPGWFNRIDTGTLTLHDPCGCIVGQLCGSGVFFTRGLRELLVDGSEAVDFGFDRETIPWASNTEARRSRSHAIYQLLQDAWIVAIADRKLRADAPVEQPALVAVRA